MARIVTYTTIDMSQTIGAGEVVTANAGLIEITSGADTVRYGGSFDYGPQGITGLLTGHEFLTNGILNYKATGLTLDASFVFSQISADDFWPVMAEGLKGNDELSGAAEADVLFGFAGDDLLEGFGGNDVLAGDDDADTLVGGAGDDTLDGGEGWDTASYADAPVGVRVTMASTAPQLTGHGSDVLIGIEEIIGSSFADVLSGAGSDNLFGGAGDDTLIGGAEDTWLFGGAGDDVLDGTASDDDTARYDDAPRGVTVSLAALGAQNTNEGWDTLRDIENLAGSVFADTLIGSDEANKLGGFEGNDSLYGGLGDDELFGHAGDDVLDGEGGIDWAIYDDAAAGVRVSLAISGPQATGDGRDRLVNIENLLGSDFDDRLTGDDGENVLKGIEGNDFLFGGGADDVLSGGDGDDRLSGGRGADMLTGGDWLVDPEATTVLVDSFLF